jgi:predicted dehydrogenase
MIKAGIIGCGKIADLHAESIGRIPKAKIIAACDKDLLMAKQLHERFKIDYFFDDLNQFLSLSQMDVVHITTPPQFHYKFGKMSLEAGFHVYIEKPFTLNSAEAADLLQLAEKKGLKVTVGHNAQFTHAARYFREIVQKGFLGGPPVHLESYYCYNFGDEAYAKALLGDDQHWVRKLPGRLLHNIISHGISKIAEFISSEKPIVVAFGHTSPLLKNVNEHDIVDELRVIIYDNNNLTAFFTFSSQIAPSLHQLRLYGPKNSIIVDDDNQTVIKISGKSYKSYLNQFVPPFIYAREYLNNANRNIKKFLKNDFHNDSGMKHLIQSFYSAILFQTDLPISYREILLTTRIMDDIFSQVYPLNNGLK